MEGERWIPIFMGMTYGVMRLPHFLRKLTITEGLKLTIFTCKWGKCVKPVGKYLLESLI
jgi:hypothetical protein